MLVVLGKLLDKTVGSHGLEPLSIRLDSQVLHLRARVLHAQKEERDLAERGLHPVPSPAADLQRSLQILVIGNVSSDKVLVEPHDGVQIENHGNRSETGNDSRENTDLVGQSGEEQALAVGLHDAVEHGLGLLPSHVVRGHDLADEALLDGLLVAIGGHGEKDVVGQLRVALGHGLGLSDGYAREILAAVVAVGVLGSHAE